MWLVRRVRHLGSIVGWGWAVLALGWSVLANADLVVSKYGSTVFQAKWNGWWHPHWSGEVWVIGLLVIALLMVFEGSFRHSSKQENAISALQATLQEIEEAKPNIALQDPGAEHIQTVPFTLMGGGVMILSFAKVRFVNKPLNTHQRLEAKRVIAKIKFYDSNDSLILRMDGRWDDSDQPSIVPPGKSRNDLLPIDFLVEQEHNLDLAFWDHNSKEFVAWNNDSCDFPLGRKPQHVLKGERFKVEIRLVSTDVDKTFYVQLATDEFGPVIQKM